MVISRVTLKPCPFCGGEARMEVTDDFSGSGGHTALVMFVDHDKRCMAMSVNQIIYGYIAYDPFAHPEAIDVLANDFAERWNRRA
jgi:hypothetical protein